jgi:hypothetical protein
MYSKIISLLAVVAASIVLSGCKSNSSPMADNNTNILGIVKIEKGSYGHTGRNTVPVNTDEVVARTDFSGDKYTFLWGLITIKDY